MTEQPEKPALTMIQRIQALESGGVPKSAAPQCGECEIVKGLQLQIDDLKALVKELVATVGEQAKPVRKTKGNAKSVDEAKGE